MYSTGWCSPREAASVVIVSVVGGCVVVRGGQMLARAVAQLVAMESELRMNLVVVVVVAVVVIVVVGVEL